MNVKLPGHRPGLPGKVACFYIMPLAPLESGACGAHPGQSRS
jgi:hypothetical protein